jgi:hypothetical protein
MSGNKVADVLNLESEHLAELCKTSWQSRTLHGIRKCRTVALGGHIDKCSCCSKLHLSYNSCRNRHCPTCQGHKREQWIQQREQELLPVGYFHVVFTLPSELHGTCLRYPRESYKALFAAAWETLQGFGNNPKHLGAQVGMIAILHTWGQNMSIHPHLHCIVPGGGVTPQNQWKPSRNKGKFLFNVTEMSIVFRAKYVEKLRKLLPGKVSQDIYEQLFTKKWIIYAKKPFSHPKNVVEYLGRYTHKIAISNQRIVEVNKATRRVRFLAKDYKKGGKKYTAELSTFEFIRRFSMHILPKGFTRMRHYGILSSSWKKEKLPRLQEQLGGSDYLELLENLPQKTQLNRCPICKKGTLVTVHVFGSRGPPKKYAHLIQPIRTKTTLK